MLDKLVIPSCQIVPDFQKCIRAAPLMSNASTSIRQVLELVLASVAPTSRLSAQHDRLYDQVQPEGHSSGPALGTSHRHEIRASPNDSVHLPCCSLLQAASSHVHRHGQCGQKPHALHDHVAGSSVRSSCSPSYSFEGKVRRWMSVQQGSLLAFPAKRSISA